MIKHIMAFAMLGAFAKHMVGKYHQYVEVYPLADTLSGDGSDERLQMVQVIEMSVYDNRGMFDR